MDINSLLSPEESPAGSPVPTTRPYKSRLPKASPRTSNAKSSPLSQTSLPSDSGLPAAVPVAREPLTSSPTRRISQGRNATETSPRERLRITRQASTSGMDTLADLASMQQHHQQTARASTSGLRNSETYDGPKLSTNVRPSLQAIARTHSGSQSTLDIPMTDVPTHTPPPRSVTSSSLPQVELQDVGRLLEYLVEHPNSYESHVQLIGILRHGLILHMNSSSETGIEIDPRSYDLLPDLQQARDAMASRFPLGEELWIERLQDNQMLASTLEECITLVEMYEKAVADEVGSTKLWALYGDWMLSLYSAATPSDQLASQLANPLTEWLKWSDVDGMVAAETFSKALVLETWKRGVEETKNNINDSHLVWDKYTDLILQDIDASTSMEAITNLRDHFVNRLKTPHVAWDETFQKFSNFVSRYANVSYEETMVEVNRKAADAKVKYDARSVFEARLKNSRELNDKTTEWTTFSEYLEWETTQSRRKRSRDLTNALFRRALLRFPLDTSIWEDYFMYLGDEFDGQHLPSVLTVLGQACRHCPWSGSLWAQYIQAAERDNKPFADIGEIKHKATSTGLLDSSSMEEVLKIHTAWCSFLRRQAFYQESTDEERDVAEVGIRSAIEYMETLGRQTFGKDYKGDPQYRLERIYIEFLGQSRNYGDARGLWKKLATQYSNSYEFWLRYYNWEMITWARSDDKEAPTIMSTPSEATKVLFEATKVSQLDWPEKIIETYLHHCEDHEDALEFHKASVQCRKATKAVTKRRERETQEAAALAKRQAQAEATSYDTVNTKRKRDDGDDVVITDGNAKRSRADSPIHKDGTEDQKLPTRSTQKRDRENTTVIVRKLPATTTEKRVKSFFVEVSYVFLIA